MLRTDDYNSNIVSRFPVEFISETISLTNADGILAKELLQASEFFPGSVINSCLLTNTTITSQTIDLSFDDQGAKPFLSITLTAGETKDAVVSLATVSTYFQNGIRLAPQATLYCRSRAVLNNPVDITLFGSNY